MYVLLLFINQYDQEGGYFVGVFGTVAAAKASVDHLGRRYKENTWYELKHVVIDALYSEPLQETNPYFTKFH